MTSQLQGLVQWNVNSNNNSYNNQWRCKRWNDWAVMQWMGIPVKKKDKIVSITILEPKTINLIQTCYSSIQFCLILSPRSCHILHWVLTLCLKWTIADKIYKVHFYFKTFGNANILRILQAIKLALHRNTSNSYLSTGSKAYSGRKL